jgi:ribonuclease P protein component
MTTSPGRFNRSERVRQSKDYQRIARDGVRSTGTTCVVLATQRPPILGSWPRVRLGITASRKVGNAVRRNRVKRRIREWFRTRKELLEAQLGEHSAGIDLVVIARSGAVKVERERFENELQENATSALRRLQSEARRSR